MVGNTPVPPEGQEAGQGVPNEGQGHVGQGQGHEGLQVGEILMISSSGPCLKNAP